MKKTKILFSALAVSLFIFMFPVTAFANSSWVWFTSTRPLQLLPIIIIVTLVTEIYAVNKIAGVRNLKIVIPVVTAANLLSFIAPYFCVAVESYRESHNLKEISGLWSALQYTINKMPVYNVSIMFLILTLIIETPFVYSCMAGKAPDKKKLFFTILLANILTTAISFAVERLICPGRW